MIANFSSLFKLDVKYHGSGKGCAVWSQHAHYQSIFAVLLISKKKKSCLATISLWHQSSPSSTNPHTISLQYQNYLVVLAHNIKGYGGGSGAVKTCLSYRLKIASLNPNDATAISGQEGRHAYSLLPHESQLHSEIMHAEGRLHLSLCLVH